jgi:hypothetical protein
MDRLDRNAVAAVDVARLPGNRERLAAVIALTQRDDLGRHLPRVEQRRIIAVRAIFMITSYRRLLLV